MQNPVDNLKDLSRPSHEDATKGSDSGTNEKESHHRINQIANEMADRGLRREHRDDQGVITESDPHGTNV